jgi:hypothetical protein
VKSFDAARLLKDLHARSVVRVTAMRGTLHLLSARDYLAWRGPLQPALDRSVTGIVGKARADLDLAAADRAVRRFLARAPATFEAIRDHLGPAFPHINVRHLAYALRMTLPLVQVPAKGAAWGFTGAADFAVADTWLGTPVATRATSPEALVRRYLGAFGPASVADAQAWSGLPKLAAVLERLRPSLVTFRNEGGRELFDLPDAPRPDPDTPAPVRFLPEFDSLVLGHHDRRRVIADEHRPQVSSKNLQIAATFLVDGRVAGVWSVTRSKGAATLVARPFGRLAARTKADLAEEGDALLAFAEPDAVARTVTVKA